MTSDLDMVEIWRPRRDYIGPSMPAMIAWQRRGELGGRFTGCRDRCPDAIGWARSEQLAFECHSARGPDADRRHKLLVPNGTCGSKSAPNNIYGVARPQRRSARRRRSRRVQNSTTTFRFEARRVFGLIIEICVIALVAAPTISAPSGDLLGPWLALGGGEPGDRHRPDGAVSPPSRRRVWTPRRRALAVRDPRPFCELTLRNR